MISFNHNGLKFISWLDWSIRKLNEIYALNYLIPILLEEIYNKVWKWIRKSTGREKKKKKKETEVNQFRSNLLDQASTGQTISGQERFWQYIFFFVIIKRKSKFILLTGNLEWTTESHRQPQENLSTPVIDGGRGMPTPRYVLDPLLKKSFLLCVFYAFMPCQFSHLY